ncbi:modifier of mdg4-like isoform X4 [Cloeon dipterum]|uniref:modifier of mdg4-like isoform X4 n=1 Tax=Cloeon dipterum TaxID=197152 RepID=UPI00321F6FE5
MDSQVYSLKWNNFVPNIMSSFRSLRRDRDLVDVTLSCEGKRISVHKVILSACSSYFRTVLKENPAQHPVIIFRNVSFDDLQAIIDFVYNGEVSVEQNRLTAFLQTAELLEIKGLTNESCNSKTAQKTEPYEAETYPTCSKEEPETPEKVFPKAPTKNLERVNESPAKKRKLSEVEITPIEPLGREEETTAAPVALDEADHELSYRSVSPESQAVLISDEELDGSQFPSLVAPHDFNISNESRVTSHPSNKESAPTPIKCTGGYRCSECNKVFSRQNHCKSHIKVHLGETVCHLCGKTFPFVWNLKSHLEFHQGLTKCDICNKTLGDIYSLNAHRKRHFRDSTEPI